MNDFCPRCNANVEVYTLPRCGGVAFICRQCHRELDYIWEDDDCDLADEIGEIGWDNGEFYK